MKQRGMTHQRKQALADHAIAGNLVLASHTKCCHSAININAMMFVSWKQSFGGRLVKCH